MAIISVYSDDQKRDRAFGRAILLSLTFNSSQSKRVEQEPVSQIE